MSKKKGNPPNSKNTKSPKIEPKQWKSPKGQTRMPHRNSSWDRRRRKNKNSSKGKDRNHNVPNGTMPKRKEGKNHRYEIPQKCFDHKQSKRKSSEKHSQRPKPKNIIDIVREIFPTKEILLQFLMNSCFLHLQTTKMFIASEHMVFVVLTPIELKTRGKYHSMKQISTDKWMRIKVHTNLSNFSLDVLPHWTIMRVKNLISFFLNINADDFYLKASKPLLDESATIAAYGVNHLDNIYIEVRGKGGSKIIVDKLSYNKTSHTSDRNSRYLNLNLNQHQSYLKSEDTGLNNSFTNKLQFGETSNSYLKSKYNTHVLKDSWKGSKNNSLLSAKSYGLFLLKDDENCKYNDLNLNKSNTSNSTLSLHVKAYENSTETDSNSLIDKFKDKCRKKVTLIAPLNDKKYGLSYLIKNPFEFPRQENAEPIEPEVSQYRASQKLANPNEISTGKTEERRVSADDFFANSMKKIEKQNAPEKISTTLNSRKRKTSFLQSPHIPPEKKPRFNSNYHKDMFSNIVANAPSPNPHLLENVRLNNTVKEQEDEIARLRRELKEATSAKNKFEKESNYEECGDRRKQQIVSAEIDNFTKKYGSTAPEVISKMYSYFNTDDNPQKFSPALTGHIFQASGISLNKARKLRHELFVHNAPEFLASERKVNEEKKKIREGIDFEEIYVKLKTKAGAEPETKLVTFIKNPESYTQHRVQHIRNNGIFRKIIYQGREELWFALTIDKALARTTLGLIIGNTLKKVNSAYNISFLGIYEADDSSFNINAAFAKIFELLGQIKEMTFNNPDGTTVTLPVRWFYVADYKSEKGVFGLKGGNPTYPSINCLSKMQEKYSELDLSKKCPPRPPGCQDKYSQERPSLAPFIPPSHFIPPPLHMTMGPGAQLFEYLFELVAKLDADRGDAGEAYHLLKENPKWKKELRGSYAQIQVLQDELKDLQETGELYDTLLSFTTNERKLKPCSLNSGCVVNLMRKNVPSHFVSCCNICSKLVHRCCKNVDLTCPHCNPFQPTIDSGKAHLIEEQELVNIRIGEIIITISEKENLFNKEVQKLRPGPLTKTLEKVLEKHGGSRKAFFQAYSGAHLIKMGNNLDKIIEELPAEITSDEKTTVTLEAIKLFFEAKKSMKKELNMSAEEIAFMKNKILTFGTYMKDNLGSLKTKQKGHLFLFEAPEFAETFGTCSFFTDEAIEAHNAITNEQDKRIKCKECPKRYSTLLKWAIYNNYYYDNIECKDYKE